MHGLRLGGGLWTCFWLCSPIYGEKIDCSDTSTVIRETRITPLSLEDVKGSLSWRDPWGEQFTLASALSVEGMCRTEVTGFEMARIFFGENVAVDISSGNRLSAAAYNHTDRYDAIKRENPHPSLGNAVFVTASRIDSRMLPNGRSDYFVGLWQKQRMSSLAVFSRQADRSFSRPQILLLSKERIDTVAYFPSPDSSAGQLAFVQQTADGPRLFRFDWLHSDAR